MQVGVFASEQLHEWTALLRMQQYRCVGLPTTTEPYAAAMVICEHGDTLLSQRFWLMQITAPICLITPAFTAARELARCVPLVRVISHPHWALRRLDALLPLTSSVRAGYAVLRAPVETTRSKGGAHGYH